ncbi:polyphenol oxidase family protein [Acidovorax sp. SRB_24]|uniref:polyphenol oxidase family protein n=1 Tax=Acidovorax sp. SRB_24 TaxID=1962700 RepID=UPI00145F4DB3|nr:laccase domain-containing protein [Acidovorax sp. SRB_24]NMM77025.1 laccase [Acidovorax sp. SRB_24]
MHLDWLVPDWPAPAHVHALCTTRAGGASAAPYDSLNLGGHVGDDPAAVQANRRVLQAALAAATPGAHAIFLQQVHGTRVLALGASLQDGNCADACVATAPGQVCTIMVADCLPVLLTDRQGRAVAAAHAGWRGLAGGKEGGVLEAVFREFSALALAGSVQAAIKNGVNAPPVQPQQVPVATDTLAWLGPCIGPQAFEVGAEVHAAFCAHDGAAAQHFRPHGSGKYLADLAALARQRLHALGVSAVYGNDSSAAWCTVANPSRFFSHRRDSAALGGSGRFAACVWIG